MKIIILLGPPGAGKGSLSQRLVNDHNFKHLSTGALFRNIQKDSETLKQGTLFGDDYVNQLVIEALAKYGDDDIVLLDGYPRTQIQASFLEKHFKLDKVFLLGNLTNEILLDRLSNRLLCKAQGHSFNAVHFIPKVPGICDFDGSELYRRADDQQDVAEKRLAVYREHTQPLIDHYKKMNNLIEIDATLSMDVLAKQIIKYLT